MAYVICQPCIGVKDGTCARECPVECIYPGDDQYYVNPEECIDCGACVSVCPVDAIFNENVVPPHWKNFIQKNADHFRTQ